MHFSSAHERDFPLAVSAHFHSFCPCLPPEWVLCSPTTALHPSKQDEWQDRTQAPWCWWQFPVPSISTARAREAAQHGWALLVTLLKGNINAERFIWRSESAIPIVPGWVRVAQHLREAAPQCHWGGASPGAAFHWGMEQDLPTYFTEMTQTPLRGWRIQNQETTYPTCTQGHPTVAYKLLCPPHIDSLSFWFIILVLLILYLRSKAPQLKILDKLLTLSSLSRMNPLSPATGD